MRGRERGQYIRAKDRRLIEVAHDAFGRDCGRAWHCVQEKNRGRIPRISWGCVIIKNSNLRATRC